MYFFIFTEQIDIFVTYNQLPYNHIKDIIYMVIIMITKKLGTRIKELRIQTGLSQEKFALKIDMDRTYFASVEAGKRNISIINIKKISDGLGVSLSKLFEGMEK